MAKAVTVNFEITNQSFQKLNDVMKRFHLEWDTKVFKSIDKLGGQLDKLSSRIYDLNLRMAKQRLTKAQQTGTGTGSAPQFDMDKFFDEFGKEMSKVTDSMSDAAKEISKLKINVTGSSSAIGDEKAERDASTAGALVADGQRKLAQQELRDSNRKVTLAMDHRLKQERLMTRHMMQMFGGGLLGGSLGLIFGQLKEGLNKKFTSASATSEYAKTQEGESLLKFQKTAQGSRNPLGGFGEQVSTDWQEKGVTTGGLLKAGSASGRAKSWMGRRIEGAQTGDMSKMFGGKKGMMLAGGAVAGVAILKKAISLGIESSPMMQQMLKLWKFGIMMIFRPIGDFFGFFLRPIFVMLLRKFIIPFYQEYLPLMQTLGYDLGTKVVGLLEAIAVLFGGHQEPETYDVSNRLTMNQDKDLAVRDALAQSMEDNSEYWQKFFDEQGTIPPWVKNILDGLPAYTVEASPENVSAVDAMGGGVVGDGNTDFLDKLFSGFETVGKPYQKLANDINDKLETGGVNADLESRFIGSSRFDLATNEGLLAAQEAQATSGSTSWTINMYSNISGAGTEEVNDKIEKEMEDLPARIEEETQKQIEKKYGRVNPRNG